MAISDQLRTAVEAYASINRTAKEAGIPQSVLQRFVAGQTSLSLANVDRLCDFFGMRLTKPTRKRANRES